MNRNPRTYFMGLFKLAAIKRVGELVRIDPSGYQLIRRSYLVVRDALFPREKWVPSQFISEADIAPDALNQQKKLAIVIHVFHTEYVVNIVRLVLESGFMADFFITSPKPEIVSRLQRSLGKSNQNISIILSQNRGRNFGPLLTEVGDKVLDYEFMVHLHSKKTDHADSNISSKWARQLWDILGSPAVVSRAMQIMSQDAGLAVMYPDLSETIPARSYEWGPSKRRAEELLKKLGERIEYDRFAFPAGGMFLIRTSAYTQLFASPWKYEDFPPEAGQIEGTIQHAIEKYIGYRASDSPGRQILYVATQDRFTVETDFINH